MNTPYPAFHGPAAEVTPRRVRDVTWGRILFQPPTLNPRLIFDPLPFRTQLLPQTLRGGRRKLAR